MEEKMSATLESIQQAAMQEFLDKGFQGASLRQIVKNAGVTTGAFYGYFSSKEALFNALVEPHAAALMGKFMEAQTSFAELPEEQQPDHMGVESSHCVHWMVDYICQHREPVKLLLTRSEGTSYEHFVHNMVEVEVEYTLQYMEVLRRLGKDIPELDKSLCHIIASGCSDNFSKDAAICNSSFCPIPSLHRRFVTLGVPSVIVPVLSKTTACTLHNCSRLCASRIRILFSAPLPIPTIIAVGVANPNAQGQAITNTVTEVSKACVKASSPPAIIQPIKVSAAIPITAGTKIAAILSTNCCTGALLPWASCTILIIWAKIVSLPTFSAMNLKLPF
mgnify:CR=1 FL=1